MKKPLAALAALILFAADGARAQFPVVSFEDIVLWAGDGKSASNRAGLILQWNLPDGQGGFRKISRVWGYGWNSGEPTGYDMLQAVIEMDKRLGYQEEANTVFAMLYDADGDGGSFAGCAPGVWGVSSDADGAPSDSDDLLQSGWVSSGFWEYYVFGGNFEYDIYDYITWEYIRSDTYDVAGSGAYADVAWFSAPIGSMVRTLVDGSWDAYSYAPGFVSQSVAQPVAATLPVPQSPKLATASGHPVVQAVTRPDYSYQLQVRDSLTEGEWVNLGDARAGGEGLTDFSDLSADLPARRYYRIAVSRAVAP